MLWKGGVVCLRAKLEHTARRHLYVCLGQSVSGLLFVLFNFNKYFWFSKAVSSNSSTSRYNIFGLYFSQTILTFFPRRNIKIKHAGFVGLGYPNCL